MLDPQLNEQLKVEVLKRADKTPVEVRNELKPIFGSVVSLGLIKQIRDGSERSVNIEKAKTEASRHLDKNNGLVLELQDELKKLFFDPGLTLRERMEASKELRSWTKLGIDAAGMYDRDGDTLFIVGSEWSTSE